MKPSNACNSARQPGQKPVTAAVVAESPAAAVAGAERDADPDTAIRELYSVHHRSLVRLAALLVRDAATAEEVVQDAFVAAHGALPRLRDTGKALSYLHQCVVSRSRSELQRRAVAADDARNPPPGVPGAGQAAISAPERSAVVAALRVLPARQREALVLRYYADLSEADAARAMGISRGAVKSHAARGMSVLRPALEDARGS